MVMLWSSLATKDARLAVQSLRRLRPIPAETSWATYVRCHDDIGWAVGDVDARAVGYDPFAHRDFLNAFYSGRFPLSFARGALFGENPRSGDARISGSAAALCGISEARERGDADALDAGHPAARAAARRDARLGRRAAALHGRRAGAGQRRVLPRRSRARRGQPVDAPALLRRRRRRPPPRAGHRRGPGLRLVPGAGPHPGGAVGAARRGGVGGAPDATRRTCWPGVDGIRAAATSSGWSTSRTSPPPSTSACSPGSAGSTRCWPRTGRRHWRTGGSGWPGCHSSGSPRNSRFVATIRIAQFGRVPCAPTVEVGESDMAESAAPPQEARSRPAEATPLHPALVLGAHRHRRGHLGRPGGPRVRQVSSRSWPTCSSSSSRSSSVR